jgi:hypothetical protein
MREVLRILPLPSTRFATPPKQPEVGLERTRGMLE